VRPRSPSDAADPGHDIDGRINTNYPSRISRPPIHPPRKEGIHSRWELVLPRRHDTPFAAGLREGTRVVRIKQRLWSRTLAADGVGLGRVLGSASAILRTGIPAPHRSTL
jgi:hypothetical protein